jgi:hypothetical protein
VFHKIDPIQSGKPLIPTAQSSQCKRAQAFRIGVLAARHALVGMTQKGSQRGVVLSSGDEWEKWQALNLSANM